MEPTIDEDGKDPSVMPDLMPDLGEDSPETQQEDEQLQAEEPDVVEDTQKGFIHKEKGGRTTRIVTR